MGTHKTGSNTGNLRADTKAKFNAVKVFSATMQPQRDQLGDTVTRWLAANPEITVVDIVISQSSDAAFHCVAITVFYWQELAQPRR